MTLGKKGGGEAGPPNEATADDRPFGRSAGAGIDGGARPIDAAGPLRCPTFVFERAPLSHPATLITSPRPFVMLTDGRIT